VQYRSIKVLSTLSIAIPARELRETFLTLLRVGIKSWPFCAIWRNRVFTVRVYRGPTVASETSPVPRTALCLVPFRPSDSDRDPVFARAIESFVGWTGTRLGHRPVHLDEILVISGVRMTFIADLESSCGWPDVEPFVLCALCDSGRECECCEWVHGQLQGTRLCARTPQGAQTALAQQSRFHRSSTACQRNVHSVPRGYDEQSVRGSQLLLSLGLNIQAYKCRTD